MPMEIPAIILSSQNGSSISNKLKKLDTVVTKLSEPIKNKEC